MSSRKNRSTEKVSVFEAILKRFAFDTTRRTEDLMDLRVVDAHAVELHAGAFVRRRGFNLYEFSHGGSRSASISTSARTRSTLDLDAKAADTTILPRRRRFSFSRLEGQPGRPFVAVLGPRGSGKTVMLRQLRSGLKNAIYISADTLERGDRLAEVVRALADRYRIHFFLIDEIHFLPDYPRDLKEIYDFSELNVWFTSSVALSLHASSWDLSRRVLVQKLLPFSFRGVLAHAAEVTPEAGKRLPLHCIGFSP